MDQKLYRSNRNKMFAGVCGGIGERFNLDPTIIRILWVAISFFLGFFIGGIIVYLLFAMIMPIEPDHFDI